MKKIGKILAALTAATLCVGALPAVQIALPRVSIAASAESADGLTYQLINDSTEVAITGCDDVTSVTVPSEIEGKPVTTIAERALSSKSKLLKVTLPDSGQKIPALPCPPELPVPHTPCLRPMHACSGQCGCDNLLST